MDLDTFKSKNLSDGEKGRFLNAFNDIRPDKRMAYFEHAGVCYTASSTPRERFGPLFKLCLAGIRGFSATRNYQDISDGEHGALMLHNATCTRYTPSFGSSQKINSKTFKTVRMGVADDLANIYSIPANVSPIISDIQSESPSVKNNGKYIKSGTRTIHRLYLATAFTILRKLHAGGGIRDGVVALIVDRHGRIISWGRKNPNVPCWHGETISIMRLSGRIPEGCRVYSTLKPCNMCAGLIHDTSSGNAKVLWGQDDPGSMASNTILQTSRQGQLLDGNKTHNGARAILLKSEGGGDKEPMPRRLDSSFQRGAKKSTIDHIVTDEAATIIKKAETHLKTKHTKYVVNAPEHFNENTAFVVRYLTEFLGQLNLKPDDLGQ